MNGNDVNVRFGGDTRGLDQATQRAKSDIASLKPTIQGLGATLGNLKGQIQSAFNMPNLGGATEAVKGLGLEMGGLTRAATGAAGALPKVALAATAVAVAVVAISAAVVSTAMSFGKRMGEMAEKINNTSKQLGMSTAQVSQWSAVLEKAGIGAEALNNFQTRLGRSLVMAANGGKQQSAAFAELGINVKNVASQNDLLLQMSDKFSKMEDGPKKIALAMMTMGRSGAQLIPVLNQGRAALQEQMQTAERFGAVMDESLVQKGLLVDDAFDDMDLAMKGVKNTLFSALAPAIQVCAEYFNGLVAEMVASYRAGGLVRTIVDIIVIGFKGMVTVIMTVIEIFKQLYHVAMAVLTPIVGTLSAVTEGVAMAVSGNWSGALTRFKDHMGNVAQNTVGHFKEMNTSAVDYGKTLGKLWSGKGLGAPRSRAIPLGPMDLNIPGMGGGGSKKDKKPKQNDDALQAALEELEFRKDMARDDFAEQMRLQDEKLALLKKAYGEDSQEYKRALREKLRMTRDHDQEVVQMERDQIRLRQQLAENSAEADKTVQDQMLERRRQTIEMDAQNGRISEQKKVQLLAQVLGEQQRLEREAAANIFAIQKAAFEAELRLQNLRPQERQKVLDQMKLAEMKFTNDMRIMSARQGTDAANMSNAAATAVVNKWKSIVSPIQSAFGSMFQSLYMRQMTFKQAAISAIDSIVMHWAQKGIEWLANWTAMQLAKKGVQAATNATEVATHTATEAAKTAVTTAAATTRAGVETAAATAAAAIGVATRVSEVIGLSGVAAAAAFASTAAIPIIGPVLAPGAAAAAMAAVLGFVPLASAAEGWGEVPKDGAMTELHRQEMVLPAKFANPLRTMLTMPATGMAAGAGMAAAAAGRESFNDNSRGDVNLHYGPSYGGGPRHMDMDGMLKRDGARLIRYLKRARRDGEF